MPKITELSSASETLHLDFLGLVM